jgi:hypothetical protein
VGHVGGRVDEGFLAERAPEPVREPVGLAQVDAQAALQQHAQARRAEADEPGGDLRVHQVGRADAAGPLQDLEVLAGGVHDARDRALQQLAQRGHVHRQGVDHDDVVTRRQLQQGQLGEVGALAVELGVEREDVRRRRRLYEGVEGALVVDPAIAEWVGRGR